MLAVGPEAMNEDFDIVIVGGGLVGASLACALDGQPLRVAVVEAAPARSGQRPGDDARSLALSYGSRRIFEGLGVWPQLASMGVAPIRRIHVSDRGHMGMARLDCADAGVEALGYVVANRVLGKALEARLHSLSRTEVLRPARVASLDVRPDVAEVTIRAPERELVLKTRLLVGADGMESAVRDLAGIRTLDVDYGQTAVVGNLATERPHQDVAYERFTDTGPLALLPLYAPDGPDTGRRCALVWTVRNSEVDEILALDDRSFLQRLQARFGRRLGTLQEVSERGAYRLQLRQAREHVRARLALIGNAAHTLHPVAGQGFNLGLRDVAVLSQVLADAVAGGRDPGDEGVLQAYARWRRRDHLRVIGFTDGLVRVFSNALPPVVLARNIGLLATDLIPGFNRLLIRQAMGLTGRLPRLAQGLPLKTAGNPDGGARNRETVPPGL